MNSIALIALNIGSWNVIYLCYYLYKFKYCEHTYLFFTYAKALHSVTIRCILAFVNKYCGSLWYSLC